MFSILFWSKNPKRSTMHATMEKMESTVAKTSTLNEIYYKEQKVKVSLQLTQDSVASNVKNTVSACIKVNNNIAFPL